MLAIILSCRVNLCQLKVSIFKAQPRQILYSVTLYFHETSLNKK